MDDVSHYDVLLLIRAKECGNTAPACSTGVKIADRQEDNSWPDEEESADVDGDEHPTSIKGEMPLSLRTSFSDLRSIKSTESPDAGSTSTKSRSSPESRERSSTAVSGVISASTIGVTSAMSILSDISRPNIIWKLLVQLTEIHDQRQVGQSREWDAFVRQRGETKQQYGGYLREMLKPCLRCNSVSSPSVLDELEAKGVHTSKRANIVSPSKVAELYEGCTIIVSVVIVTGDKALPENH